MRADSSKRLRRITLTKFPSQSRIIDTILQGILHARESFYFWTNHRLSLSYAHEKIVTMYVAQEIGKMRHAPEVFMDSDIRDILRCSLKDRDSYPDFMRKRGIKDGIFTIVLDERFEHKNDNDSISKVLISVRNAVINSKKEHLEKVDTICKMLYLDDEFSSSSLDYCIFAFYSEISSSARKKLDTRFKEITKKFDDIVKKYPNLTSSFYSLPVTKEENKEEWSAGTYVIKRA